MAKLALTKIAQTPELRSREKNFLTNCEHIQTYFDGFVENLCILFFRTEYFRGSVERIRNFRATEKDNIGSSCSLQKKVCILKCIRIHTLHLIYVVQLPIKMDFLLYSMIPPLNLIGLVEMRCCASLVSKLLVTTFFSSNKSSFSQYALWSIWMQTTTLGFRGLAFVDNAFLYTRDMDRIWTRQFSGHWYGMIEKFDTSNFPLQEVHIRDDWLKINHSHGRQVRLEVWRKQLISFLCVIARLLVTHYEKTF